MTPNAKDTLNDILTRYKNGDTDQETTARIIEDLFKREPVNYKRTYSDASLKLNKPVSVPEKGQIIGLSGHDYASGQFKVMDVKPGQAGAVNLSLQRIEGSEA